MCVVRLAPLQSGKLVYVPRFINVPASPISDKAVPVTAIQILPENERGIRAKRNLTRAERQQGPEFRRREPGPDGRRKHRRMIVGSVNEFINAARQAITGPHLDINPRDERAKARSITVFELADHYRSELNADTLWRTYSTIDPARGQFRRLGW